MENLNRRVALYAPPSLLTSPDLFTLPSDEDEEFSRKLQGGDDNNLDTPTKTSHDSSGKSSSLLNGKGEGGSQPEGADVSGSVSGSLHTGSAGSSEREKDPRGHSLPNDNKRERSDMSASSSSDFDEKGLDSVNHKRQDVHGSPSCGGDTRNEGGGAVGEGGEGRAESLPACSGVNSSSSSSGRGFVGMPGGGGKLMRKDLVLSETAFVKLIDAFEKETHAKGGNENSLTHKEAIRIARENLKLELHSVLVKQVQAVR